MAQADLLVQLADGEFHSGQVLAGLLGVSRTAVWKQLAGVESLGITLESVRGRGYRIPGGLDLLSEAAIRAQLAAAAAQLIEHFAVLGPVDSTNAYLAQRVHGVSGRAQVCTAEQQLAGRGRRGRSWASPFARNIYLSIAWQFNQGAAALEGLSLAAGVAVADALASLGITAAQLKWPNDLVVDGEKLGGILIEMSGDANGACRVVLGLGMNVSMPADLAAAIDQPWTDVSRLKPESPPSRNALVARLLDHLLPMLAAFETEGFAPWQARWLRLDAHRDQPVILSNAEKRLAGIARGVNARGGLQLETTTGVQEIYGGELSLRRAP